MKKILITGATGFIGSHLTELALDKGYEVIAFDRYNPNYSLGHLENSKYKKDIQFIFGDIRDYDSVNKAMKKCNVVFHLAALIGIPYSYISPLAYLKTNLEGTYNILESAKNLETNQVIITSTSETYGTAKYVPIDEKHQLNGQSPYAASKIAADQLSISYWNSFKLPVKIIRPFNTFGPRQSGRAVIPSIILQALHNKKEINLGNINTTRDLTYVLDTCHAYFEMLKNKNLFGIPVNVGSKNEYKIKDIAKKIILKINPKLKIKLDKQRIRPINSEVQRLVCGNKLILNKTNWKPKTSFNKGLDNTIEWFKKFRYLFKNNIYHI
tara:strand:+ start:117 stop:1091 length:975 start_codon:yes stop_codon:yes gene_type:complete